MLLSCIMGDVGSSVSGAFTILETKIQDISVSDTLSLILALLFKKCLFCISQHSESAILNHWSTPLIWLNKYLKNTHPH